MTPLLLPHHADELSAGSGISPDVIAARGYRSVTAEEAKTLGFAPSQCHDGLAIPQWTLAGVQLGWLFKPGTPGVDESGKTLKYEAPAGSVPHLDIHPDARHLLLDPSVALYFTEGNKKADAAFSRGLPCVSLTGVWQFARGKLIVPDFDEIHLKGRVVRVVYDSDVTRKRSVAEALFRLCEALRRRGARVEVVYLPEGPSGAKVGLDDWFVAGGIVEALDALAVPWEGKLPGPAGVPRLVVRSLADVEPREVEWFWPRWLARGKLNLLAGHAGDGKSTLMTALAAIGSTGGAWPDGAPAPQLRTLFVLGEDAAEDTLRPRLELHGADMHQIFFVETVLDDSGNERFFNVGKHLDLLEDQIVEHGINLIVIDLLTTIMPGTDRNAEGDTRDALTPLVKLAERRNVAIIGIAHVGKPNGTTRRAAQRILGATAFHAMARVVWMVAPVDDEQLALGVVKSNLAVKPATLLWSRDEDSPVSWDGMAAEAVDELLSSPGPLTRLADAEAFLHEFLKGGMKTALEVEKAAVAAGVSKSTLRRAADTIGVLKWKDNRHNGPWYWRLPDVQPRARESAAA